MFRIFLDSREKCSKRRIQWPETQGQLFDGFEELPPLKHPLGLQIKGSSCVGAEANQSIGTGPTKLVIVQRQNTESSNGEINTRHKENERFFRAEGIPTCFLRV